jgi:hypothetical protein
MNHANQHLQHVIGCSHIQRAKKAQIMAIDHYDNFTTK